MAKTLAQVQSFLYLISNSLEDPGVESAIASSPYDLVMASFAVNDPNLTAAVAAANPAHDKILLGYFDLTEASASNNPDLFSGPLPSWFGTTNPGWAGIYSVQYWAPQWESEVFSQIDRMIAAGFDGVFFDVANGDTEWLPGNSFGNPGVTDATAKLEKLVSDIHAYIASKNLAHPFYIIPNTPSTIAQADPAALHLFDAIFNECAYYYNQDTQGSTPGTIVSLPADPAWTLANASAFESAGIPVLGNDYPTTSNLSDDFRSFAFYSALGWVPSVQGSTSSAAVLSNGPFMAGATAAAPVVQGVAGKVNFLSGGLIDGAQLVGGDQANFFIGGPGRNSIVGGPANDTIYAHPANAVFDHILDVAVVTGAVNASHPASLQVLINGQVAADSVPVTATFGSPQHLLINTAQYGAINSIQVVGQNIYYASSTDFNNVFLMSMSLNGAVVHLAGGQYNQNAQYLTYSGGDDVLLNTDGTATFAASALPSSPFLPITSDTIDGGAGLNTVVYRANFAQYSLTPLADGGFTVASKSTAEGPDVLHDIERLQFADKNIALDLNGHAGIVARILGSVFGVASLSNETYVGIGLKLADAGTSFQDLMKYAIDVQLGTAASDKSVVDLLYTNVTGNAPPSDVEAYYVQQLQAGTYTQSSLAVVAAETLENAQHIGLAGLASTGLPYLLA
jgi:endo-alpha-1,4-polygalactosaminidase (GH114 family)